MLPRQVATECSQSSPLCSDRFIYKVCYACLELFAACHGAAAGPRLRTMRLINDNDLTS